MCEGFGGDLTDFTTQISNSIRVLAQAQGDLSLTDIEGFSHFYWGPPAGAEILLLQQDLINEEVRPEEKSAYAFAMAVKSFGRGHL